MRRSKHGRFCCAMVGTLLCAAAATVPARGAADAASDGSAAADAESAAPSRPSITATIDATIRAMLDATRDRSSELARLWHDGAAQSDDPLVFLARALEAPTDDGTTERPAAGRLDAALGQARDDPLALTLLAVHCADAAPAASICPAWSPVERLTTIDPGNGFHWFLRALAAGRAGQGAALTAHLLAAATASRFDSHASEMLLRFVAFYRALDRSVSISEAILLASDEVNRFVLPSQYPELFRACDIPTGDDVVPDQQRQAACEALADQVAVRGTTMLDQAIGVALMKRLGGTEVFGDDLARIDLQHRRLMAAEIDCPSWRIASFGSAENERLGEQWLEALRAGGELGAIEQQLARCYLDLDTIVPVPAAGGR